jgi:nitric oxide reductase NorE protein
MEDIKPINYKNIFYPPGGILIWIIIFLELITFGIALIALALFSKEEPQLFHESRLLLNPTFGVINTIFLLTSGYFMAKSLQYIKDNNIAKSSLYLKLTILGGLLFLGLKSIEYYEKIEHGLTMGHNTFFNFYWLLTGFHVIHVFVGIVILSSVLWGLNKKKESQLEDFEASTSFWHMCDLIWLLLFPMLYLIF